ncbi:tetratricopeptide repeat protein [Stieleria varia]|uniref:Tetratricopeptide repeat protein n=1 Tax=Stieleria varia TaxID=2528005 RepID=A0A5C5ZPS9_9BACT|nr:tetratricopeptide repeat protein [Stieleria varia]TWT89479.1 hypothetical protein Pla52n_67670 [Stieleria varia]
MARPVTNSPRYSPPACSRDHTPASTRLRHHACLLLGLFLTSITCVAGCSDDRQLVREIQTRRQNKMQTETIQDHLGETVELLDKIVGLDPEKAQRQIAYHLNQWNIAHPDTSGTQAAKLLSTISELLPPEVVENRIESSTFAGSDTTHLRDCYLFRQIVRWVDTPERDDLLLESWFETKTKEIGEEATDQLRTASRLFDWTIRNVAFEPLVPTDPAPPTDKLKLPHGMQFRGAGIRQSDYYTVMHGTGDPLQRAGVFTQLCRQVNLPAAVLATRSTDTGELTPFCVGVLIADEVYLFEPALGTFIPESEGIGIATLSQARDDELIMRRLSIAGLDQFKYPLTQRDIQQCVALLNLLPEAVSPRMKHLQSGLTGDRRMNVYVDADQLASQFEAVKGIASVRMWDVPLLAEIYRATLQQYAQRDPIFGFWFIARWAMMEADFEMAKKLSKGRWQHLCGVFGDDELESIEGARSLYLAQRAPEFEIEDLMIDVDLQIAYGVRRELGISSEIYDQQIRQIQGLMRMGKRTATYWLSLLQYDDLRYETAANWLSKRVLNEEQLSYWVPPARYNLGRTYERTGEYDKAMELYKTNGDPQEHGNRIRARLLGRFTGDE